jgi:hypothetical protein
LVPVRRSFSEGGFTAVRLPRTDRSRAKARPAISLAQPALPRPPHSEPNVRDDRDTPLLVGRNAEVVALMWGNREQVYFCGEDWTRQITLK